MAINLLLFKTNFNFDRSFSKEYSELSSTFSNEWTQQAIPLFFASSRTFLVKCLAIKMPPIHSSLLISSIWSLNCLTSITFAFPVLTSMIIFLDIPTGYASFMSRSICPSGKAFSPSISKLLPFKLFIPIPSKNFCNLFASKR